MENIQEKQKIKNLKEKEFSYQMMVKNMMVNGKMVKWKVKEQCIIITEINIQENG